MHRLTFRAVAWAPYIASPENLHRTDLAVAWTEQQCSETRRPGFLRVPSHASSYTKGEDLLAAFARRHTVVTNRGRSGGRGVYLVPMAYPRELASAMSSAADSSLCATEHPAFPLRGWAMVLGAIDLSTGEPTRSTITGEQMRTLEHMATTGYNSWSSAPGSYIAPPSMARLADSGLSYDVFVGALMALAPNHADPEDLIRYLPARWRAERDRGTPAEDGPSSTLSW